MFDEARLVDSSEAVKVHVVSVIYLRYTSTRWALADPVRSAIDQSQSSINTTSTLSVPEVRDCAN